MFSAKTASIKIASSARIKAELFAPYHTVRGEEQKNVIASVCEANAKQSYEPCINVEPRGADQDIAEGSPADSTPGLHLVRLLRRLPEIRALLAMADEDNGG